MWINCYGEIINTNLIQSYYWYNGEYKRDCFLVIIWSGKQESQYFYHKDKGKELYDLLNRYIITVNKEGE